MESIYQPQPQFMVEHSSSPGKDMAYFHYHSEYELFFIDEGSRSIIIDDTFITLSKFDVGLVPSNAFHRTTGSSFSRTIVYFSPEFLKKYFSEEAIENMLKCFESQALTLTLDEYENTKQLLIKMQKENINNNCNKIFVLLGELLMNLSAKSIAAKKHSSALPASTDLVSKALNYINQNYANIKSLDEIAANLFITKYHLCRIFKQATLMTVTQYINSLKIKNACDLLIGSTKNVSQIGKECGYASPIYFSQCFKKQFNMTPISYRALYKEKQL